MSNILEPNFNGLPPVTDWEKVFVALQQANEKGFRGATAKDFGKQIIGDVAIQGADFEDLPIATSAAPVALPVPEAEMKFGFLANGTYTQPNGPDLVYTDVQWGLTLFDGEKWVKKFTLTLPKGKDGSDGKDGKTTEPFNSAKPGGYLAGDPVYYGENKIYSALVNVPMGESPATNPEKWKIELESSVLKTINSPAVTNQNIRDTYKITNKGIINGQENLGIIDNTAYDCVVIPVGKKERFDWSNLVVNGFGKIGIYKIVNGVFILLDNNELLGSYFSNGISSNLLTGTNINSTNWWISPDFTENVYLIINIRMQGTGGDSNINFKIYKYVGLEDKVETVFIEKIDNKNVNTAEEYVIKNNVQIRNAIPKLLEGDMVVNKGANLYDSKKDLIGFGNINLQQFGKSANYDSFSLKLKPDSYYSISGDTIAVNNTSAQTYCLCKLENNFFKALTDIELNDFNRLDGILTNKAFYRFRNTESFTIKSPSISDFDVYLVLNTRFTTLSNKDTLQVEESRFPTQYYRFGEKKIKRIAGVGIDLINYKIPDGVVYFFGDSITLGTNGGFVNLVKNYANIANVLNFGINGAGTERLMKNIKGIDHPPKDYLFCDKVYIMIGHNSGVTGSISDIINGSFGNYPDTGYGRIAESIEYIFSKNPDCKIYLGGCHLTDRENWLNSYTVSIKIKEIANYFAIPFIDVLNLSGISRKNSSITMYDNTHLTEYGNKLIANCISKGLTRY